MTAAVVRGRRMRGAGGRQLPHQCNVKWGPETGNRKQKSWGTENRKAGKQKTKKLGNRKAETGTKYF